MKCPLLFLAGKFHVELVDIEDALRCQTFISGGRFRVSSHAVSGSGIFERKFPTAAAAVIVDVVVVDVVVVFVVVARV